MGEPYWSVVVSVVGYVLFCAFVAATGWSVLLMLGRLRNVEWGPHVAGHKRVLSFWVAYLAVTLFAVACYAPEIVHSSAIVERPIRVKVLACLVAIEISWGAIWLQRTLRECMANLGMSEQKVRLVEDAALTGRGNCVAGGLFALSGMCLLYPDMFWAWIGYPVGFSSGGLSSWLSSPVPFLLLAFFCIGYGNRTMLHVGLAAIGITTKALQPAEAESEIARLCNAKRRYFGYSLLAVATYCTSLVALPSAGLVSLGARTSLFAGAVLLFVVSFFLIPQLAIRSRLLAVHELVASGIRQRILELARCPAKAREGEMEGLRALMSVAADIAYRDTKVLDLQVIVPLLSTLLLPMLGRSSDVQKMLSALLP